MHFISWKLFWTVFLQKISSFQKFWFSAFSVDQSCLSTDRKWAVVRPKLTAFFESFRLVETCFLKFFDHCSIPFNRSNFNCNSPNVTTYCLVGFVFRETKKNAWVKRGWGWRRESARKGTTRDMQQSIFRRSNVNFINTVAHMGEKKPFILERNEHWRTFIAIGLKGKSISSASSLLCRLYIHVCFFNKTTPIISNWDISMKCN